MFSHKSLKPRGKLSPLSHRTRTTLEEYYGNQHCKPRIDPPRNGSPQWNSKWPCASENSQRNSIRGGGPLFAMERRVGDPSGTPQWSVPESTVRPTVQYTVLMRSRLRGGCATLPRAARSGDLHGGPDRSRRIYTVLCIARCTVDSTTALRH